MPRPPPLSSATCMRVCTHMCPSNCLCECICLLSGALRIIKQFVVLTPSWPTASTRLRTHADRNWPAQHTHTLSHIARHTLTYSQPLTLSLSHTHTNVIMRPLFVLLGQDFHLPSFVCGWHSHSPFLFHSPLHCICICICICICQGFTFYLCVCVCVSLNGHSSPSSVCLYGLLSSHLSKQLRWVNLTIDWGAGGEVERWAKAA